MSVAQKVSYLSRFALKFVEIMAAGAATAVSGYVVAHLGGFLSSPPPQPAAALTAPGTGPGSKAKSPHERSVSGPSAAADVSEPRAAAPRETGAAAAKSARASPAPTTPSRKRATTETAAERRAREAEEEKGSVEAQVRAALANVDASRVVSAEPDAAPRASDVAPPRAAEAPPKLLTPSTPQSVPAAEPRAAEGTSTSPSPSAPPATVAEAKTDEGTTGALAAAPRAFDLQPHSPEEGAVAPGPLPTVEVKSRPIAAVDAAPAAAASAAQPDAVDSAPAAAKATDNALLAALKKIPDLLLPPRPQAPAALPEQPPPAADGSAPRPPLPVGSD